MTRRESPQPLGRIASQLSAAAPLRIADAGGLVRWGVKGPCAETRLRACGWQLPALPNSWHIQRGVLIARLGLSEFLLEAEEELEAPSAAPGVYPVLRQDAVWVLDGAAVLRVLDQLASFDFAGCAPIAGAGRVALCQVAGISVQVLWQPKAARPRFRLYCDASYAAHLWSAIGPIVAALGGGRCELAALAPDSPPAATGGSTATTDGL